MLEKKNKLILCEKLKEFKKMSLCWKQTGIFNLQFWELILESVEL